MIWRCDLVPQYNTYKDAINEKLEEVFQSGRYILSKQVSEFEESFAQYLGVKHVVGVANGTDALILIMKALGIKAGDEVITTPYTAIPTASAIIAVGAKPVFVDICENTYLMDLSKVRMAITSRTKAIMPVHIFGNVVDIPALQNEVGEIPVIEDACQAHGSSIYGQKTGSMGFAGAFSFYPTKNLGGYGDGGAISTNDTSLAEKLRRIRMYGMIDKDHIVENGINSRLDEIQAAILSLKLRDLDNLNNRRLTIANAYRNEISSRFVRHQQINEFVTPNYHVYSIRYLGNRKNLIEYLDSKDIQTNIYYPVPLHLQEAMKYLGYKPGDLPVVEKVCEQALAITMYPELENTVQKYVIDAINQFQDDAM